jgi:hypothetical protein
MQATVRVAGGVKTRTFPLGTDLDAIIQWREQAKKALRDAARSVIAERDFFGRNIPPLDSLPDLGDGQTWVYFIQAGQFVKIGHAIDPFVRMAEFQTAHPVDLRVVAALPCRNARGVEFTLHKAWGHLHARGEWFRLDFRLRNMIYDVRSGHVSESTVLAGR